MAKVVAHIIVEHECRFKMRKGATDHAACAALLEPCLALHVVTLEEEDWMRIGCGLDLGGCTPP